MTPWLAARSYHEPRAFIVQGKAHVSPWTYELLLKHVAAGIPHGVKDMEIVCDPYLSDWRHVYEPTYKGWWLR